MPWDHPNYVGGTGAVGGAAARGNGPDVVVLAGARAGLFTGGRSGSGRPAHQHVVLAGARAGLLTGGRSGSVIPHNATVVQIDTDGGEIGRLRAVDVPIVADCGEAFEALAAECSRQRWPDRGAWREMLQGFRFGLAALFESAPKETRKGLLHPYHAAKAAMGALDEGTAIAVE